MQNVTHDATESEEKDKIPPSGPTAGDETEAYHKIFDQLIGLLADCTEEEQAGFVSLDKNALDIASDLYADF